MPSAAAAEGSNDMNQAGHMETCSKGLRQGSDILATTQPLAGERGPSRLLHVSDPVGGGPRQQIVRSREHIKVLCPDTSHSENSVHKPLYSLPAL